jgi:glycosyltransferase involved in cell wall biosynthesis
MLSVIIPAYREPFLNKTIESLLEDDVEILAVIDGYAPIEPIDKRVKVINLPRNKGMRGAINAGLAEARGELIMKVDAHCCFGQGFGKLTLEKNWLMIPRRYSLDFDRWKRNDLKPFRDYHFLNYPKLTDYGWYMGPHEWKKTSDKTIDDTMTFQGSCWIANREYFMDHVGFLDDRINTYGSFAQEQQEIALKYWLGGGEVKVNKDIWYAHLSKRGHHYDKGLFSRKYKKEKHIPDNNTYSVKHWLNNEEPNMIHPFSWLIEKFWPVPTWPEDRSLWKFQQ